MKVATLLLSLAFVVPAAHAQHAHDHVAAGNPAQAASYQASGVVKKSDAAKGSVTIAHEAIPALHWPAMTMAFKVKNRAVLDQLAVTGKVKFTFVQDGKDYVITAVQ